MALKDYAVTVTAEQILWRRHTKKKFKKAFYAEFPEDDETAFLMSGDRFFDSRKI
jgi:cbb3-type cytochrome oxidase subunit 3